MLRTCSGREKEICHDARELILLSISLFDFKSLSSNVILHNIIRCFRSGSFAVGEEYKSNESVMRKLQRLNKTASEFVNVINSHLSIDENSERTVLANIRYLDLSTLLMFIDDSNSVDELIERIKFVPMRNNGAYDHNASYPILYGK